MVRPLQECSPPKNSAPALPMNFINSSATAVMRVPSSIWREPYQLEQALGAQKVGELSRQTGVPQHALLDELAGLLPKVIDRLTPQERLPDSAIAPPRP